MKRLVTICLMACVLAVATSAWASTTKWVDQAGGSDGNDGNTEAAAYATLQFAIDNSVSGTGPGDRSYINVKDGTYGIAGQVNQGAYATAILIADLDYLTIQAVPGHSPKVMPVTAIEAYIASVSIQNSNHLVIDNIDSDQTVAQFDNWHVWDSGNLTLRNSTFEGGEDGIDFNTGVTVALIESNTFTNITTGSGDEVLDFTDGPCSDITIQDNTFDYNYRQITLNGGDDTNFIIRRNIMDGTNSEEAIRLISASDVLVENNVILNNLQQGIYVDNGCTNITIIHNTFFNNDQEFGGNGELRIKPDPVASNIIVKNNIINGNGTNPPFESVAGGWPGESNNLIYNDDGSFNAFIGAGTIIGQDPLFVSTVAGSEDLHLQSLSPAHAAGTDLGVTDDTEGNSRPRPALSNPDIGAYEQGLTEVWVDDDYCDGCANDGHIWGYDAFDNIKDGIAAVEGSTVNVAPGTYVEDGQIVIDKDVTIVGDSGDRPVVKTNADTGSGGDSRGWWLVLDGSTLNLQNLILNGEGHLVYQGIRHLGQGSIENVDFVNIKFNESGPSYSGLGIAAFGDDGPVNLSNCSFSEIGRVGILYFGSGVNGSVYDGCTYVGKGDGNWLDYGVEAGAGAQITVSNSTISDCLGVASSDGSTSAGILVTTYYGAGTEAVITGCTITNCTTGIAVGYDGDDTSVVVANNNNIFGNGMGIDNVSSVEVDAENNWWGDPSGPNHSPGEGDPV